MAECAATVFGWRKAPTVPECSQTRFEQSEALLAYATKLTDAPETIEDGDFEKLRAAGWDDDEIYEATALVAFFNFSGRLEAAASAGVPFAAIVSCGYARDETLRVVSVRAGHGRGA